MRSLIALLSAAAIPPIAIDIPEPVAMMMWGAALIAWSQALRRSPRPRAEAPTLDTGFDSAFAGAAKG